MGRPAPLIARRWALSGLVLASCVGPLDRKDGALVIVLIGAPSATDRLAVVVHDGGRDFSAAVARPAGDVIRDFSAVPEGTVSVDVVAYAAGQQLGAVLGRPIDIAAGKTSTLTASLLPAGQDPAAVTILDPADDGVLVPVFGGPITLTVMADPTATLVLDVHANGQPIGLLDLTEGEWSGQIDPHLAGPLLPAPLSIVVESCVAGDPSTCSHATRTVVVDRRLWRADLGAKAGAPPAYDAASDTVVIGDELGQIHLLSSTGTLRVSPPPQLAKPVRASIAIAGGRAVAVDGVGTAHALRLTDGSEVWRASLGTSAPTGAVADPASSRVIVGAGPALLALADDGTRRTLAMLPGTMRADPRVDRFGIVAADLSGNAVALGPDGALLWTAAPLTASIYAPPARTATTAARPTGTLLLVGDIENLLVQLDAATGARLGPPINLGAPVVHAPIELQTGILAVAAADRLLWVDLASGQVTPEPMNEQITGAPALWPDGRHVVLGLFHGKVVVAGPGDDPQAGPAVLSRLDPPAFSPLILPPPDPSAVPGVPTGAQARVLVASGGGSVEMLLAEGGFVR
jgi:hypothetical protein